MIRPARLIRDVTDRGAEHERLAPGDPELAHLPDLRPLLLNRLERPPVGLAPVII